MENKLLVSVKQIQVAGASIQFSLVVAAIRRMSIFISHQRQMKEREGQCWDGEE